ncbi:hypothetical protein HMPREF0762_00120 [Slackia exigua ATCC 700122]|uniref:Uncharacterized protein n=1 Tax=Slackia exigua (strain ATCC 700122 / DSM 15923 / CIP 105133 / JCM 11022 / KCTC 5966 / S-7) TaxID=649764 RepID=D0WE94_SLAES|nr:hypothetical protein HMPREF0762_00120 [Slackia exigua ATCC 700122]
MKSSFLTTARIWEKYSPSPALRCGVAASHLISQTEKTTDTKKAREGGLDACEDGRDYARVTLPERMHWVQTFFLTGWPFSRTVIFCTLGRNMRLETR